MVNLKPISKSLIVPTFRVEDGSDNTKLQVVNTAKLYASLYMNAAGVEAQQWTGAGKYVIATNTAHPMTFHCDRFKTPKAAMTITAVNDVVIHTSLTNNSDGRLKTNKKNIRTSDAIRMLKRVNVKTYNRIDLPNSKTRLGFIAQDIQKMAPDNWGNLVTSHKETNGRNVETETLSLDYARLCCVLWECSKNILGRVEVLEAKLKAMTQSLIIE